ncbi:hypothetical protein, partial [uncultured Sphingomonas sp.]|uniref:hypothetical protein n=1 Tax=uncultured Sphingomonas sp. TaxID=158754 RepID=UPI0025F998F8
MIEPTTVRPERVDARGDAGLAARGSGRPARAGVAALFLALLAAPGVAQDVPRTPLNVPTVQAPAAAPAQT